ncbi:hypothetical protein D3C72_2276110 [compost metagenome]
MNSSITKLTTTSSSDTDEVSAATSSRKKNSTANSWPPTICANTAGMVMKVSPGPADGSKPKANTAGSTISPARKQVSTVSAITHSEELSRLASLST